MKTSVKNLMMSFALMGCLIIGASDASAQGRGRSQGGSSNRSQSAAVSRTNNSSAASVSRSSSATPQVSRSSSSSSRSASATPQVNRSTPTSSRSTSVAPHAGSSSSTSNRGTIDRNTGSTGKSSTVTTPTSNNRPSTGATTRGIGNGNAQSKSGNVAPRDNKTITSHSTDRTTLNNKGKTAVPDNRPDVTTDKGDKNRGGNMGNDRGRNKDRSGGSMGNDRGGNKDRSGGSMGNDRGRNKDRSGGNMGNDRGRNKDRSGGNRDRNGNHGYSPNNHYDYSNHHYRDQFSWNYSHHSWSRPLPPPARAHRPAPLVWYRPVIPVGWHPYANAPVIDRILGLMFGSLYEASLDHLYYNGYFIDGYADGVIYLRDVPLMDLYWPDVMLNYEFNKLVNAQFVYHSSYYDRARFDRVYRSLYRVYGPPVFQDGMTISWYGGNNTGWVTLTMNESYGDYYTTMSIGY